eukprot:TRINITY_DN6298_c0_g1_i4.p1 TRINITY_DN6298_c0_g1~~TRINITY_DN6298_c0_g1_i4.p1  ORF type:complete len:198 (-),score=54.97 TRINITY_DN6298_c0_g1_i4:35-628(-)
MPAMGSDMELPEQMSFSKARDDLEGEEEKALNTMMNQGKNPSTNNFNSNVALNIKKKSKPAVPQFVNEEDRVNMSRNHSRKKYGGKKQAGYDYENMEHDRHTTDNLVEGNMAINPPDNIYGSSSQLPLIVTKYTSENSRQVNASNENFYTTFKSFYPQGGRKEMPGREGGNFPMEVNEIGDGAVSYTHLTLPTIYSV